MQTQDRRRSSVQIVAVIFFTIYVLGIRTPQVVYYWLPQWSFGFRDLAPSGLIKALDPHSAAADAGLHVGDQIETKSLSLHEYLATIGISRPRETVRLDVLEGGHKRNVTLVARPSHFETAQIRADLLGQIGWLVRVALCLTLVLIRPGRMTWLFYIWMMSGGSYSDYLVTLPGWLFAIVVLPYTLLSGAVPFIGLLFYLVFPNDALTGWRSRLFPYVVGACIVFALIELARLIGFFFRVDTTGSDWIGAVEDIVGVVLCQFVLFAYYVGSSSLERRHVRWILMVTAIGMVLEVGWNLHSLLSPNTPVPWFWLLLNYWGILLPAVFAYAIVRYRMFDVEFILSRGLVYTLLAIAAAGTFLLIDLLLTSRFHGSRAELAVDIAAALGIGFWMKAIHGHAIDLVDRLLFRRRYESRILLKAAVGSLATADSPRAVEETMTSGAASALGLASAVFFRRVADGGLLREIGVGWPADAPWHLLPDDKLVTALERNAPSSIDLQDLGWSRSGVTPPQRPVVAVPMKAGARVVGVTLYGSRSNDVLPSPDEISGLIELAQRATTAYLMLDAVRSKTAAREPVSW